MTIKSDFRFAIFDRGRNAGLTQRRGGAKPQRNFCRTRFVLLIGSDRQTIRGVFRLCAFVTSRLCVEIHGSIQLCAVKAANGVVAKNRTCKCLIINGAKSGQGQSRLVKPIFFRRTLIRGSRHGRQKFAGLAPGKRWHPRWQNLALSEFGCQLCSDKVR
jgi:hypothetical protein